MQEVQYQKDKLRQNLEKLRERSRENALLKSVVEDYQRYEERLLMKDVELSEQHTAHETQLLMLSAYIQDIIESNELTESGLNKLIHENQKMLDHIRLIKTH